MNFLIFILFTLLLSSCTLSQSESKAPLLPAKQIVEKPINIALAHESENYHLQNSSNPSLIKAYQDYMKTGKAKTIETDQFVQFPFNANSQPIVAANTFELTIVSLEPGEQVSSVSSGDPSRWSYSVVYSGANQTRQAHVMLKPSKTGISTDFFITTDRRAYNLKLFSSDNGKYVREVRFWYPQLMTDGQNLPIVSSQSPSIEINQLNFNYHLVNSKSTPVWMPQRVFDDGSHTYIQFTSQVNSSDLPILFIDNGHDSELVNYRYKAPYFIVDKIFKTAVLLSDIGKNQHRVTIKNENLS